MQAKRLMPDLFRRGLRVLAPFFEYLVLLEFTHRTLFATQYGRDSGLLRCLILSIATFHDNRCSDIVRVYYNCLRFRRHRCSQFEHPQHPPAIHVWFAVSQPQ